MNNSRGMSFIEVLIGLGMVGIITTTIGLLYLNIAQYQKRLLLVEDNLAIKNEIEFTINNYNNRRCANILDNLSVNITNFTDAQSVPMPSIFNNIKKGELKILSLGLRLERLLNDEPDPFADKYSATLIIEPGYNDNTKPLNLVSHEIALFLNIKSLSTTSGIVDFCMADTYNTGTVCAHGNVLTGHNFNGEPICATLPGGSTPPPLMCGIGCSTPNCVATDGGACQASGCITNGHFCQGANCRATGTHPCNIGSSSYPSNMQGQSVWASACQGSGCCPGTIDEPGCPSPTLVP